MIGLILLWLFAGIPKVMDIPSFSTQLKRMPYIGWMHSFIAVILPILMLAIAVLLAIPKLKLYGLYLSAGLLCCFTIYIAWTLLFSDHIPCSCAGIHADILWKDHVFITAIGLVLNTLAIWLEWKNIENLTHKYNKTLLRNDTPHLGI
ncbi:hypothetical protein JKG61_18830 [Sphingobacterium sp. C459-1T]|uniref:Methylamine utilisation protein MauE domain-containing protein n=1 Tax=Sphingobacterium faecale TaxID=2803775 RepID=A0ABS1R8G7_9SPHI|nr:MauE/DoxX family redox-associated membrane protein [Sphingobacterium faecale]MBL1410820.1 hypothetical protein [Sphingobacterium faecale]